MPCNLSFRGPTRWQRECASPAKLMLSLNPQSRCSTPNLSPTSPNLRWCIAASNRRWTLFTLLFLAAILTITALLGLATGSLPAKAKTNLWALGFGAVHLDTLVTSWSLSYIQNVDAAIVAATLIANTPQITLSFLYITLNGLVLSMFLTRERSSYVLKRKAL
jgi:hypothetical protein